MLESYLCNTSLEDTPQHDDKKSLVGWTFSNIDGANVPLCWECEEKMYEYKQDAMAYSISEE